MANPIFKVLNPIVKMLLNSPLHFIMSGDIVLLKFTGRKSGRALSTPVSYRVVDGSVHCFTDYVNQWWRNLQDVESVELLLKGKSRIGRPIVISKDQVAIAQAFGDFLTALPRSARFSDVRLDKDKIPNQQDIERAAKALVFIEIKLSD
ncbi:MAG: hypothetical protein ACJAYK_002934 [Crocinitomicaceae bacterium]|jgi:hypothetical protein